MTKSIPNINEVHEQITELFWDCINPESTTYHVYNLEYAIHLFGGLEGSQDISGLGEPLAYVPIEEPHLFDSISSTGNHICDTIAQQLKNEYHESLTSTAFTKNFVKGEGSILYNQQYFNIEKMQTPAVKIASIYQPDVGTIIKKQLHSIPSENFYY